MAGFVIEERFFSMRIPAIYGTNLLKLSDIFS
jgi:hypothetical protein